MSAISQIQAKPKDLIPISFAFIVLILFGLLVTNQWALLSSAQKELEQEKELSQELVAKKDFINELEVEEDEILWKYRSLDSMIPKDTEYVEMLDYLQSIFIEYNLNIDNINFGEKIEQEGYSEMPIEISLMGDYKQIIEFLKDFRLGDRIFRVDDFQMSRQDDITSQIYCDLISYAFFRTVTINDQ